MWFWYYMGWGGTGWHLQPRRDIYERNINVNSIRKIGFLWNEDEKSLYCTADSVVCALATQSRIDFKRGYSMSPG